MEILANESTETEMISYVLADEVEGELIEKLKSLTWTETDIELMKNDNHFNNGFIGNDGENEVADFTVNNCKAHIFFSLKKQEKGYKLSVIMLEKESLEEQMKLDSSEFWKSNLLVKFFLQILTDEDYGVRTSIFLPKGQFLEFDDFYLYQT